MEHLLFSQPADGRTSLSTSQMKKGGKSVSCANNVEKHAFPGDSVTGVREDVVLDLV